MKGIAGLLVEAMPLLITAAQTGFEVWGIIDKIKAAHASSEDPTAEEWQAVNAEIAALRARLHRDPQ